MALRIILIGILFCWQSSTLAFDNMPDDVMSFLFIGFFDPNETDTLALVCKSWNGILSEDFWRIIYKKKTGYTKKINEAKSFKDNYYTSLLICHTNDRYELKKHQNAFFSPYIKCEEIFDKEIINNETYIKTILDAIKKSPQVFCTIFCPSYETMANLSWPEKINSDTIIILPAGNESKCLSKEVIPFDIHKIYPHTLLVAASTSTKDDIAQCSNYGDYVDIAAIPLVEGTGGAVLTLALFVAHLRSIRPSLKAHEIISIIKKTAIVSQEIETKLPSGGILNEEMAIKKISEK